MPTETTCDRPRRHASSSSQPQPRPLRPLATDTFARRGAPPEAPPTHHPRHCGDEVDTSARKRDTCTRKLDTSAEKLNTLGAKLNTFARKLNTSPDSAEQVSTLVAVRAMPRPITPGTLRRPVPSLAARSPKVYTHPRHSHALPAMSSDTCSAAQPAPCFSITTLPCFPPAADRCLAFRRPASTDRCLAPHVLPRIASRHAPERGPRRPLTARKAGRSPAPTLPTRFKNSRQTVSRQPDPLRGSGWRETVPPFTPTTLRLDGRPPCRPEQEEPASETPRRMIGAGLPGDC